MKFCLYFLFTLFLSVSALADDNSELQSQRFTRWTDELAQVLETEDADEAADKLVKGIYRVASFNLQALGRLYQRVDSDFFKGSIRSEFKLMEDAIGESKKQRDLLKNAKKKLEQTPEENVEKRKKLKKKILKFKNRRRIAKVELKYLLTSKKSFMRDYIDDLSDENEKTRLKKRFKRYRQKVKLSRRNSQFKNKEWIPSSTSETRKLKTIVKAIKNYDWGTYQQDRSNALNGLIDQLKAVKDETTYSFDVLENETAGVDGRTQNKKGIHEIRREIRWFNLEAGALGGLVAIEEDKVKNLQEVIGNGGSEEEIAVAAQPLKDSCPIDDFKKYMTDESLVINKYTTLPANPKEKVCTISTCLYYAMAKIIADIGDIKDYVEEEHSLSNNGTIRCLDGSSENYQPQKYQGHYNNVPSCIENTVEKIYQHNIKDNKLMEALIHQLRTCKNN